MQSTIRNDTVSPLIVEGLYSFQLGGSERLGATLAAEFVRRGYRVHAYSISDDSGPIRDQLENQGVVCHGFPFDSVGRIRRVMLRRRMRKLLQADVANVFHAHHGLTLIRAGDALSRSGALKVVMTEHSDHALQTMKQYRARTISACRGDVIVTAVDQGIADYLETILDSPKRSVQVIPNAVDSAFRNVIRSKEASTTYNASKKLRFLFVGRLHPDKDLGTLLRAYSVVTRERSNLSSLDIAGDGPESDALSQLARQLGIDTTLTFLGARANVVPLMSEADVFVMSSKREGLPVALLEAMAAGLACIATNVGGIGKVLSQGGGFLVPAGSPEDLAKKMIQLIDDRPQAAKLGSLARDTIDRNFSLDSVIDRYLRVFELPPYWQAHDRPGETRSEKKS